MRRLTACVMLVLAALAGSAAAQPAFDGEAWVSDLRQAQAALSAGYANFDWAVSERGMDLPRVTARAEQRLRAAGSDAAARRAFERFLESFADGHLTVEWPSPPPAPGPAPAAEGPPAPLCARLGYADPGPDTAATATRLPGYASLATPASAALPAGVVDIGGRKVGVLRIALFSPDWAPGLCEQARAALSLAADAPCDDACRHAVATAASRRLQSALEQQLVALAASGVDTLIVDLGGNGGGSDWSWTAVQTFSPRPLRTWPVGLVRHPHHAAMLRARRQDLETAAAAATGQERARLLGYLRTAQAAEAELQKTCDRSSYWTGAPASCPPFRPFYVSGWTDRPPAPFSNPDWTRTVHWFEPSAPAAPWRGKLVVLINRHTHSAAEGFAALLRDNGVALLAGAPSAGTGCGHINGRITERLRRSGGLLVMPNCSRYRADGANEVGGIEPDVLLPFRETDSQAQRARRLQAALPAILQASDAWSGAAR